MKTFLKLLLIGIFLIPTFSKAQNKSENKAKEGEFVYVIVNYVKNEAKAEYEKFMNDVFMKTLMTSTKKVTQQAYSTTRWLIPASQNEDKSWSFIFIMDPVVDDANYSIENLFQEKYSATEANELLKKYESFMAKPMLFNNMIQSKY